VCVPKEFAKEADAEVVLEFKSEAFGSLSKAIKLSDLPVRKK